MDRLPHHSVHRIILPSGRKIEVVRFDESGTPHPATALHVCPECRCELVQPVSWAETPGDHWELELFCPNCQWTTDGVYDQAAVEELEEHLDEGLATMLGDLQRLTHANMVEEVERFVVALHGDQILPEDF